MATWQYELARPPKGRRKLELWLQHAAGFILLQDVRGHAIEQMDPNLSDEARTAALKAIDDAIYGLMAVIDGVTGTLSNAKHRVLLNVVVRLLAEDESDDGEIVSEIDLADGDGMCMGVHGWMEDDFGKDPIAVLRGES